MWSDAGDHGEDACVKEKAWGGLDLPEELDGVEAEDGGAQSLALPTFWVTRGQASGTGRCARSNGACSCEPGAEGWSGLAGTEAAVRRSSEVVARNSRSLGALCAWGLGENGEGAEGV